MGNLNQPLVLGTLMVAVGCCLFGFTIGNPLSSSTRTVFGAILGIGFLLMIYGAFFYRTDIKKRGYSRNWEDQG